MARKQKMKVYHGIPKSITDEHTLFYESCDGKLDNSYTVINPISFYPNATGYGVYGTTTDEFNFALTTECKIQTKVFTVDFWATMKTPVNGSYAGRLFEITFNNNSNYKIRLEKDSSSNRFHIWENANLVFGEFDFSSANINKPHHFRIIFKVGDYCKMYIDGKEPNIVQYQNKLTTTFEYISHIRLSGANFSVSDFHISNIDRGDYFPNLPQDFIDGKAVIKPRMGQQQIKGDPMYSQVTELKVPPTRTSQSNWIGDPNWISTGSNSATLKENPEISTTNSNFHDSGSLFKIKGLNGEIISGIVDTDTALCRVVNIINSTNVVVDSVNALAVGDTVKWLNTTNHTISTATATITEIDSATKRISFTGDFVDSGIIGMYVVETTASSSSPTVKTLDGTNVVGTWSGLGTSEAIFTLGENSNITGKDLYVQYALTMPYGNSDFPELPYSIKRAFGENDVEMKPVNEILIRDDFKGKESDNLSKCPHYASFTANSQLVSPQSFTKDNYIDYNHLYNLDSKYVAVSNTTTSGNIGQVLLAFDLITMVETKLGKEIPSRDKVEWLRNNISKISLKTYATGSGVSGNLVNIKVRNNANTDWVGSVSSSQTSFNLIDFTWGMSEGVTGNICSDGFCYFLIYAPTTDGVTPSAIRIDYTCLDIKLKTDSTYVTLYCENTRAREDVCNPVLIQKETKTVKRYLPSKEIFSTECTRHSYKDNLKSEVGKCLVVSKDKLVTTSGTSTYVTGVPGVDTYADKFILPGDYKWYDFDNTPLQVSPSDMISGMSHSVKLPIIRYWGGRCYHGAGSTTGSNGKLDGCQTITTVSDSTNVKQYEMYYALKTVNNELVLTVQTGIREANNKYQPSLTNVYDYKLPNRPLIK